MNKTPVKLGPLALLLTVISICLTTLAILTFATARADRRLAEKYAGTVLLRYELDAEGQEWLRNAEQNDETVLEKEGSTLSICVEEGQVTAWRHERAWEEDLDLDVWPGFGF